MDGAGWYGNRVPGTDVTTLFHFWNSPTDRNAACKCRPVVRAFGDVSGRDIHPVRPLHPSAFPATRQRK